MQYSITNSKHLSIYPLLPAQKKPPKEISLETDRSKRVDGREKLIKHFVVYLLLIFHKLCKQANPFLPSAFLWSHYRQVAGPQVSLVLTEIPGS